MKIYWFEAQAPRRVVALAKYLKVPAEYIHMDLMGGDLKKPEYAILNPNQKAPVMIDEGKILWESVAIMAYLAIKYESDMWPTKNASEQTEMLRWITWTDTHWSVAIAPFYFEYIIKQKFGMGPVDHELLKNSEKDFLQFASVLNDHLQDNFFIALNRLTIADFQAASMASYWRNSKMPMEKFPNIIRWLEQLDRIPAWADPWPST